MGIFRRPVRALQVLLFVILLLALLLPARPVSAHANLIDSDPAAGQVLDEAPEQVELTFSEAVDARFTRVRVLDVTGAVAAEGEVQVNPADERMVTAALPALPDGAYTLDWAVRSALDGHTTRGTIGFSVGRGSRAALLPPLNQPLPTQAMPSPLDVVIRWVSYIGAGLALGAVAFALLVWRPAARAAGNFSPNLRPADDWLAARLRRLIRWGLGLAFASSLALVFLQAAQAGVEPYLLGVVQLLDFHTGYLFWVRAFLIGLFFLYAGDLPAPGSGRARAWWEVAALGAMLLLTYSLSGHNAALNSPPSVVADWLHMLAMAAWLGALPALALLLVYQRLGRGALAQGDEAAVTGADAPEAEMPPAPTPPARGLPPSTVTLQVGRVGPARLDGMPLEKDADEVVAAAARAAQDAAGAAGSPAAIPPPPSALQPPTAVEPGEPALPSTHSAAEAADAEAAGVVTGMGDPGAPAQAASAGSPDPLAPALPVVLRRFSRVAELAVLTLAASGIYAGAVHVRTVEALTGTRYGQALMIKLGLFLLLVLLGALNMFGLIPNLAAGSRKALDWLGRTVRVELVAGGLVLLLAGFLLSISPAYDALQAQARIGDFQQVRQGPVSIRLGVAPARAGENEIAADLSGVPEGDLSTAEVLFRFRALDGGLDETQASGERQTGEGARAAEPARYTVRGSYLSRSGPWQVEVILRRPGQNDVRHRFRVEVGAPQFAGFAPANPFPGDQASIQQGAALYAENCAPCHGASGRGDGPAGVTLNPRPVDLTQHMLPGKHTDGDVYYWITEGVPGSAMPAFEDLLTEEERWHVVNFIRTLAAE